MWSEKQKKGGRGWGGGGGGLGLGGGEGLEMTSSIPFPPLPLLCNEIMALARMVCWCSNQNHLPLAPFETAAVW